MIGTDSTDAVVRQIGARIRAARQARGMTLDALAAATGLSTAFLSRLERGEAAASIGSFVRIGAAIDLPLAQIFAAPPAEPAKPYSLFRRGERGSPAPLAATGYSYVPLGGDFAQSLRLDAFELEFPAGAAEPMAPVAHHGEELLYLLSGRIEFTIGADSFVMQGGDCLHFDSSQPHMGRNIGDRPARLLMVVSRQPGRALAWWQAAERATKSATQRTTGSRRRA